MFAKHGTVWVIPHKKTGKIHRIDGEDIYVLLNGYILLFEPKQLVEWDQNISEKQTIETAKLPCDEYVAWMFSRMNDKLLIQAELLYNQTKTQKDKEWDELGEVEKVDFAGVCPPDSEAHSNKVISVLEHKYNQFIALNTNNETIYLGG